jgi:hypothetical protein
MVVGFTTTCAISAYHHYSSELEHLSWRDVLDTTSGDNVCQLLLEIYLQLEYSLIISF